MIRIYAYKKIFNNSKSRLENESSLTLSQNGNTNLKLSQLFQTFARYCTITPANLYLNFSQCQRSDPASRITIRDPLWMDTCRTTKRRSWSEIEKNNKQTSKKRERNDRAKEKKRRVKRCMYKRRYEKKKRKKRTKRGKGWEEKWKTPVAFHTVCERNGVQKPKLQDVQLQAWLDERRDCQRRQQKALSLPLPRPSFLPWISSNSSKRLTRRPPPLLFDPFNDRGRGFQQGNHRLGTQMRYDRRCNYRNVIISGNISVFPFDSLIFFFFFFVFHNLHLHISNWKESRLFDCTF